LALQKRGFEIQGMGSDPNGKEKEARGREEFPCFVGAEKVWGMETLVKKGNDRGGIITTKI
jgi:hypothetical protein